MFSFYLSNKQKKIHIIMIIKIIDATLKEFIIFILTWRFRKSVIIIISLFFSFISLSYFYGSNGTSVSCGKENLSSSRLRVFYESFLALHGRIYNLSKLILTISCVFVLIFFWRKKKEFRTFLFFNFTRLEV
jgi:hypothetical protein